MSITEKLRKLSLSELANLRSRATDAQTALPAIAPADRGLSQDFPLSFAQQRLWFLSQMDGVNAAYNIPLAIRLRGQLDEAALVRALDALVARHESLRTRFIAIDGEPVQRIEPAATRLPLRRDDLQPAQDPAALDALLKEEGAAPFDLEHAPLARGRLIRCGEQDHVLSIVVHHIVSDGWSNTILIRELGELYAAHAQGRAPELAPLSLQYADYAVWQRRWLTSEALARQSDYWRERLKDAPALLELPTDRRRPPVQDMRGDTVSLNIDADVTAGLKALSQRCGVTLYMTVLAGWAIVLSRLSGQHDLVIGTPTANRSRLELEPLVGFFVNTLALRLDTSGSSTVQALLEQVRTASLAAQQNQDLPFEQIVDIAQPARSLAHSPLFQVMFSWQSQASPRLGLADLSIEALPGTNHFAKFDLLLDLREEEGRIAGALGFATALFDRATVERQIGYLERILAEMAADGARGIDALPMLPAEERHRILVEWNDTARPYASQACIHELFEARAASAPDAAALLFESRSLSYRELNERANCLAHHLHSLGVGPGARVAICVERSVEMVVGLLAILKAGGGYVPLDPAYPSERLAFMLEDAAPQVVLTHQAARPALDAALAGLARHPALVDLLADAGQWAAKPAANLPAATIGLDSGSLAYIIYTSGSTGRPKGIMVPHAPAINLIEWVNATYAVDHRDCLLFITSISFDLSVYDIFGMLAAGGTIWLADPAMLADPTRLTDALLNDRVTFWDSAPAALQLLTPFLAGQPRRNPSLRLVFNSGDWIPLSLPGAMAASFPHARFVSLGGATEATVWSNHFDVDKVEPAWRSIPYGRPIQNARYYILDAHLQPVPVGVVGNLYIAGTCLAQGYTDPALTRERFLPSPAPDIAGPLYHTGDLARFYPDGNIEFIGRNDFQVKIRGFRVELGEIEAQLRAYPGIREVVVLAREDVPGNKRLVAYYIAEQDADIALERLLPHLGAALPDYMVPTAYIRLQAMPVTANGKLDRKALPAPEGDAYLSRPYEAPQGDVETALAGIWADVLGVEKVGRHDNFFELGGHSLLAVRVLAAIRHAMSFNVPLHVIFSHPTLATFAGQLATDADNDGVAPLVTAADRGLSQDFPLSFAQQRLWFLSQMDGVNAAYNIPLAIRLRGQLDEAALVRALDALVARHESLRTRFIAIDGEPVQRIEPAATRLPLRRGDLQPAQDPAALDALLKEEGAAPFDLEHAPLARGRLIRCGEQDHVLSIVVHHIVSDGWSNTILIRELGELYAAHAQGRAPELAPLPLQYADYAVWQRRWLTSEALARQSDYWRERLKDAPALLELPTDRRRPPVQDMRGDTVSLNIDADVTAGLKALSQRCGVTLYMTVLAGWAIVLSRLSGQHDLVIGTPTANRSRLELEPLVGFFVNTLALRLDTSGSSTVQALLEQVRTASLAAQQNQDLPFEQIVDIAQPARSLAHSPLFQVMFSWQSQASPRLGLADLSIEALPGTNHFAKFDLLLDLREEEGRIAGALGFATALFDRATVERQIGYLERILAEMAADGARGIDALPMLPAEERHRILVEWNDTARPYASQACIHELFEARAASAPDAAALLFESRSLSYRELNERANRLAHHLHSLGVGPGARVAICVERSVEMVVGLLAILKAGGAYVPLDPAYPSERLAFMLEDAAPEVVLTHQAARPALDAALAGLPQRPALVDLVASADAWATQSADNLPPATLGLASDSLAYIIYTSGSTGRPKGVMIEHRSLVNRLEWMRNAYGLSSGDVVLQKTPFSFDVSVWELFGTLINGSALAIARPDGHRDPDYLASIIGAHRVTTLHFVPSMLQVFLDSEAAGSCTTLLNVFCSGEELPAALARRFCERFPSVRLHNLYGPTEATIDVTAWTCPRPFPEDETVTIGRPIDNTTAYILDGLGQPVPVGVAGELCIGGVGVARGYLNRPELTSERFVPDPFVAGGRLYRTGDLARFRRNGDIEYLGRNDFQVKLRGFRIELGEVESQLALCHGVRDAVVLVRKDASDQKLLVAYYTAEADSEIGIDHLQAHLAERLPAYMVPSAFVRMECMPVTANGKLDRKALPAPGGDARLARVYEAPVGEAEIAIAQIWEHVLGTGQVGRHDHFFELGGHSLLAVRVLDRMRKAGLHTNVHTFFQAPVLSQLAAAAARDVTPFESALPPIPEGVSRITPEMVPLTSLSAEDIERIVSHVPGGAGNVKDIYPLTHLQEGILFHHMMEKDTDPYLMWNLLRFSDRSTLAAYTAALDAVVARHDAMRTSIAWEGLIEPVQVVWREAPVRVEVLHFDPADGAIEHQLIERVAPRRFRLDVRTAPLLHLYVAFDPDQEQWLALRLIHHIIDDVTTAQLLNHEILAHIQGRAQSLPVPLPFKHAVARARAGGNAGAQEAFFRDMLGDIDEPTAPFNVLDVHGDGSGIAEARRRLPAALSRQVRAQARRLGVNAASVLHVAWGKVVAQAAGRDDAVFGTVLFGRLSGVEAADRIFGPFINTLPILVRVRNAAAAQSVRETHRRLTDLMAHEHASLALAQRCSRVPAPAPLFTAILNYRHAGAEALDGNAEALQKVEEVVSEERTNYPLVLNIDDMHDDFRLTVQAAGGIDPELVCGMMQAAVAALTEALADDPERGLATLNALPPEERRKILVEWNDTARPYASQACIHELFEARAASAPDAAALLFESRSLSYRELNERANRLAHHLHSLGVGPGARVAICVERSVEMVVGLLAILKAGGAYVPLDPAYPSERLAFMLEDAAPQVVLTHQAARPALDAALAGLARHPALVDLLADAGQWAAKPAANLPAATIGLDSGSLAYIIYTSGSTGRPKGIMVPHAPAINLIEWVNATYAVDHRDCLLFITSISFDLSVYDIFGMLAAGGTIWLADPAMLADPTRLTDALLNDRVTFWDSAPAALQLLTPFLAGQPRRNPSLRLVFNSGDWIPLSLPGAMAASFPHARFVSLGGATEATVWSNHFDVDKVEPAWRSIPYGRPIQNARYYILDAHLQPVPVGVVGNLYIAGTCLAQGYTDPALTRERFLPSPAPDIAGPLYHTGDLARFYPDGNIEFIGRNDFQVKIRGFRVELGEIEAQLRAYPGIREVVVLAREDVPGNKRLVAYYIAEQDADIALERLLPHLGAALPDYMVPTAYIRLQAMPVTANGKLDRKALPAPEGDAYLSRPYEAPQGDVETALAGIWADVLGVEKVGRHDNFFELGGHSLLAVRVLEHMRRANLQIDIRTLFSTPVLEDVAANTQEYGEIFL